MIGLQAVINIAARHCAAITVPLKAVASSFVPSWIVLNQLMISGHSISLRVSHYCASTNAQLLGGLVERVTTGQQQPRILG